VYVRQWFAVVLLLQPTFHCRHSSLQLLNACDVVPIAVNVLHTQQPFTGRHVVGGSVLIAGLALKSLSKTDHNGTSNGNNESGSKKRLQTQRSQQQYNMKDSSLNLAKLGRQNSGSDVRELAMRRRYSYTALDIEAGVECCSANSSSNVGTGSRLGNRNAVLRV
jgi:hypothetical protein